jgi:cell division protein FtsZ
MSQQGVDEMLQKNNVPNPVRIKVVGIGGGGCNAINRMVREQIRDVEFVAMNTDVQHLGITEARVRIALGETLTHGSGAGGDHNAGRRCAEDSLNEIKQALAGSDLVFLAAGMGGGTGTGSIPVVAEAAKQGGALTIAIVTKPFKFEGRRRMDVAEEGIRRLVNNVDTLIVISNDRLLELPNRKTNVDNAFKFADEILCQAVQSITETITVPGLINIDFATIRTVMKDAGPAWISMGRGSGQNRAVSAAREALSSPLIDVSINKATKVLFKFTGGIALTLFEINDAAKVIQKAVHPEANITFGVTVDPNMSDDVRLTLIATGFAARDALTLAGKEKEITQLFKA